MDQPSAILGCLLGTAVGDAIGLPREGLSRRRAMLLFGSPPLEQSLVFGRGLVSDDTEHTCMTAQAYLASHGEPRPFARSLAWRLRFWLLGIPAGVGLATLRAILKLWVGFSPEQSGVHSAGNGPAMRAAILGVLCGDNPKQLVELVNASSRLTHTDPKAAEGALLVALAAYEGYRLGPTGFKAKAFLELALPQVADPELKHHLQLMGDCLDRQGSAVEFAECLGQGQGVTGYINHTVPVALFCWLRYRDNFREAVEEVICLGGDTDTTGAIVGGLMGATLGADTIPASWLDGLAEWPRSVGWIKTLAHELSKAAKQQGNSTCGLFWPALLLRNLVFALIVVGHALRRFAPPY